jgi:hypothetical protein
MVFVMGILIALKEYEHGYPDWKQPCRCVNFLTALREYELDIQIRDLVTDVYLKLYIVI